MWLNILHYFGFESRPALCDLKDLFLNSYLKKMPHERSLPYLMEEVDHSVSSVPLSCLTLCHPMDCSTPGLPVHQLTELAQTHVH